MESIFLRGEKTRPGLMAQAGALIVRRWVRSLATPESRGLVRSRSAYKQNCTHPPSRHEIHHREVRLNLAVYLTGLAIRLQLGVFDCLAGHQLDRVFNFLRRSGCS